MTACFMPEAHSAVPPNDVIVQYHGWEDSLARVQSFRGLPLLWPLIAVLWHI